jgi:hypothetical protein
MRSAYCTLRRDPADAVSHGSAHQPARSSHLSRNRAASPTVILGLVPRTQGSAGEKPSVGAWNERCCARCATVQASGAGCTLGPRDKPEDDPLWRSRIAPCGRNVQCASLIAPHIVTPPMRCPHASTHQPSRASHLSRKRAASSTVILGLVPRTQGSAGEKPSVGGAWNERWVLRTSCDISNVGSGLHAGSSGQAHCCPV